jgi:hypothetical protein
MRYEEEGRMTAEEKQIDEMAKVIQDVCENHHGIWCTELAKVIYTAGYRKQTEGEWVSVDERLPEECKNVLCFGRNKIVIAFMEKVEDCGEYVPVFWDWVAYDRDDTYDEICATHWFPLPEAPKMRKEDEGE